jgi:hypothetical protein
MLTAKQLRSRYQKECPLDERDELIAAMFAASPWTLEEFMTRYDQFLQHLAAHAAAMQVRRSHLSQGDR